MTIKIEEPTNTTETPPETPPTPPAETPPGETPPAETPPEPQEVKLTPAELKHRLKLAADNAVAEASKNLRRRAQAAEAERDALKKRLEAGTRPLPPDPATFTAEDGTINSAKYREAMVKYEDSLHTWREAQRTPAVPAKTEESPATPEEAAAAFLERAAPLKQKYADFDQVVNAPLFTPEMQGAIFDSEHGPEIAYFLGKNTKEADRIAGLAPAQMHREIGRLEARFSATPRAVSGAPPPITPVTGTAGPTKDPEKMSTEEWMAHEKQRRLEKLKQNPLGV